MLVEPSSSQSKIIIQQFGELGIKQFKHCKTGAEALDIILNDTPDLVVSSNWKTLIQKFSGCW